MKSLQEGTPGRGKHEQGDYYCHQKAVRYYRKHSVVQCAVSTVPNRTDEGGTMKTAGITALIILTLCSFAVSAVTLESLSLGFHMIPSVEQVDGRRLLDLTLSIGGTLELDSENRIELMAMIDSGPTSIGTSAQFDHLVTDRLTSGFGFTILWPFSEDLGMQWPILGTYAHAAGKTYFYPELWAQAAISFPLLTLINQVGEWQLLPVAELPSLYVAADVRLVDQASIQPRITFQPVITDTTVLNKPFGRVSDDLLILSMGSVFLRYLRP